MNAPSLSSTIKMRKMRLESLFQELESAPLKPVLSVTPTLPHSLRHDQVRGRLERGPLVGIIQVLTDFIVQSRGTYSLSIMPKWQKGIAGLLGTYCRPQL